MSLLDDMKERLTHVYNDSDSSNLMKLIKVFVNQIEVLQNSKTDIKNIRDIDQAYGKNLDRIGENVQQERGSLDDSIYKLLIKGKIARNLSDGTINSVINVVSVMLDCNEEEVKIELNPDNEKAAIYFDIPLQPVLDAGMTRDQFLAILHRIIIAGVRAYTTLSGTFEFSDVTDGETFDSNKGFADVDQTTGGYLGGYYEPPESPPLPGWE